MSDSDRYRPYNSTLSSSREKTRAWQRSGKPLERKTPLKPVNRERRAKRKAEGEVYGPFHRHVSGLPCIVRDHPDHECIGDAKGHHLRSVGSGGKDEDGEIPTCVASHVEIHALGRSAFESIYGIDLESEARRILEEWRERC